MKKLRKKTLGFLSGLCGIALALLCGTSCGEEKERPVMYGPAPNGYEDVEDTASDVSGYETCQVPEAPEQKNNRR